MRQHTSAIMSRRQFSADIAIGGLGGLFLLVEGVLILAGGITVGGWGAGTLVQRITVGLLVTCLGLFLLAAVGLARGGTRSRSPRSVTGVARHDRDAGSAEGTATPADRPEYASGGSES
jgi:hypothetical protein